jgi:hypothetical protein
MPRRKRGQASKQKRLVKIATAVFFRRTRRYPSLFAAAAQESERSQKRPDF